jgi:glucose-6-phosphate isomerase
MNEISQQPAHWIDLLHKSNNKAVSLAQRIRAEQDRFQRFSRSTTGLLLDFSRVNLSDDDFSALLGLAEASGVTRERERMFRGERINFTEDRPVLHPLWRSQRFEELLPAAEAAELHAAVERMNEIAAALHAGHLPGDAAGQPIRHLVHIGIGGSLLGPRLLCEAFPPDGNCPQIHFLSSVDALDRERLLARLNPAETAVMLVSKSFTTSEVLLHANRIRAWQARTLEQDEADRRLFAVTANGDKAEQFGVPGAHILQMGEWTGGRYSVWSPVGVTAAVAMGPDRFAEFLAGGAAMDSHFREQPPADNLPLILGMLAVWHRNICAYPVHGLVPYDSRLRSLPAWLQQLEMESNGKSVNIDGEPVGLDTSPVVMGESGTDAQHSLFQAFHQGTGIVPLDFIGVIRPDHDDVEAQQQLLSHMLAQATALAVGRDLEQVRAAMAVQGADPAEVEALAPHRVMPGNRPSIVMLLDRLTPANFGSLLVLYEHMVLVESVVWRINAFDQWGVELGKILAGAIEPAIAGQTPDLPADIPGLAGLVDHIRREAGG